MAATTTTAPPQKATITITDANPTDLHSNLFNIHFNTTHTIQTTVTADPTTVTAWLTTLTATLPPHPIIGLDIEWRPNFGRQYDNPVATLQLSTSTSCLIFQLLHSPSIPPQLAAFLADESVTFVGVGIGSDAEQLVVDHGLAVKNAVDLSTVARDKIGGLNKGLIGLKELAKLVLGVEVSKPKNVTLSRWDCEWLSFDQIQYACVDAFLSFQIGLKLLSLPNINSSSSSSSTSMS